MLLHKCYLLDHLYDNIWWYVGYFSVIYLLYQYQPVNRQCFSRRRVESQPNSPGGTLVSPAGRDAAASEEHGLGVKKFATAAHREKIAAVPFPIGYMVLLYMVTFTINIFPIYGKNMFQTTNQYIYIYTMYGIYANMTGVYWWDPCYHM